MNQKPSWKIHIGVHKTATTHLQDQLESQSTNFLQLGLGYVSRLEARRARITKLLRKEKFNTFLPPSAYLKKLQRSIHHSVDFNQVRIKSILISDENLLGSSRDLLYPGPHIYPHLEKRLKGIQLLSQDSSVEVYLSIRSYDSLLISAYSQCLRQGWGRRLPPLEFLLEQFSNSPPDWLSFLSRIQRQLPQARVRFWTFEDYITNQDFILQALTSNPTITVGPRSSSAPASTSRLSRQCVESVLELNQFLSKINYRQALKAVLAEHENTNGAKFDPLNLETKERLRSLYKHNLAQIRLALPDAAIELPTTHP